MEAHSLGLKHLQNQKYLKDEEEKDDIEPFIPSNHINNEMMTTSNKKGRVSDKVRRTSPRLNYLKTRNQQSSSSSYNPLAPKGQNNSNSSTNEEEEES